MSADRLSRINVALLKQAYVLFGASDLLRQWGAWVSSERTYLPEYKSQAGKLVQDNIRQFRVGWAIEDKTAEDIGLLLDEINERAPGAVSAIRYSYVDGLTHKAISHRLGIDRRLVPERLDAGIGRFDELVRSLVYPPRLRVDRVLTRW